MRTLPLSALEMVDKNELSMWLKNGLADNHRVHQIEDMKAVLGKDASSSERSFRGISNHDA